MIDDQLKFIGSMTSMMFDSLDIDDYKDGDIIYVTDSERYYVKTNNL